MTPLLGQELCGDWELELLEYVHLPADDLRHDLSPAGMLHNAYGTEFLQHVPRSGEKLPQGIAGEEASVYLAVQNQGDELDEEPAVGGVLPGCAQSPPSLLGLDEHEALLLLVAHAVDVEDPGEVAARGRHAVRQDGEVSSLCDVPSHVLLVHDIAGDAPVLRQSDLEVP